jgi:BlaI family penicillinase repressor
MAVTPAESQILEALWSQGALTAAGIVEAVKAQGWGDATVKTLIHRLLKRGAIRSERVDGAVQYQALLQRADYVQAESQSLLDRLFNGELAPLVAHFAEHRALKPAEIKRLRALLDGLDRDAD